MSPTAGQRKAQPPHRDTLALSHPRAAAPFTARTRAIVLRVAPFSRTSHVVTWLTEDAGVRATAVKGACRPTSPFLGQYDLFYTCELIYYLRERDGLHLARECSPLDYREGFRTHWRAAAAGSYVCDLVLRCATHDHDTPALFPLLSRTLDFLCGTPAHDGARRAGPAPRVLFWFELRLLTAIGLAPRLAECAACGSAAGRGAIRFSPRLGGLLCARCRPGGAGDAMPVSRGVLAALRQWKGSSAPRAAQNTRCAPSQLGEIRRLLGRFLEYHLDIALHARDIALDLQEEPRLRARDRSRKHDGPACGDGAVTFA